MRTRSIPTRTALLAGVVALALTACTDDGDDVEEVVETDAASAAEEVDDGAAASADEAVVDVTLVDFGFEGLPGSVEAGTRLQVSNAAESELHELVAFRLDDDEERSVGDLAQLPPDELMPLVGEPATVLLAAPGGDQIPAVGDGTLTEPGRYAVMCFIPTGVDPDEYLAASAEATDGPPDVGDGPPHIVHGMVAELQVE